MNFHVLLLFMVGVFLGFNAQGVHAQRTIVSSDSTGGSRDTVALQSAKDSSATEEEKKESLIKVLFKGKPGRALMWSVLPGGGQFYNRRYWKVPLVYAGIGAVVYIVDRRRYVYRVYDEAFRMRVDLKEQSEDRFQGIYDVDVLQSLRREADKALFESYVWLGLVYMASAFEAFVDRHLMEFDVSEDLSMGLLPEKVYVAGLDYSPLSIGIRYHF